MTERKGVRGEVLCADWHFLGSGRRRRSTRRRRASLHARVTTISLYAELERRRSRSRDRRWTSRGAGQVRFRCALGGGEPVGDLDGRPFADWLAATPRACTPARASWRRSTRYRWFVVYRNLRRPSRVVQGPPDARRAVLRGAGVELVHGADRALVPAAAARGALDALAARRPGHARRVDGQRAARCAPTPPTRSRRRSSSPSTIRCGSARRATRRSTYVLGKGRSARLAGRRAARLPGHGRLVGERDGVRAGLLRRGRLGPQALARCSSRRPRSRARARRTARRRTG